MVFDPSRIASGFLGGVQMRQQEEARGQQAEFQRMQMEALQKRSEREEREAKKREQIGGLLGQYIGGKAEAGRGLLEFGMPGVEAYQAGRGMLQQEEKARQEQAIGNLENALGFSMEITDEAEWRDEALPYIAQQAIDAGTDPALVEQSYNSIRDMPLDQGKRALARMFGADVPEEDKPSADMMWNPSTNERIPTPRNQKDIDDAIRSGFVSTGKVQPKSEAEGMGIDANEIKIMDQLNNAEEAIALADDMLDILSETKDANTWAAAVAREGANIIAGANTAISLLSDEIGEDGEDIIAGAISKIEDSKARNIINSNAEIRSLAVTLAYAEAKANDPGGRVSGPDFDAAFNSIGASLGDPKTATAVLKRKRDQIIRKTERKVSRWNRRTSKERRLTFQAKKRESLPETSPEIVGEPTITTAEEYAGLPSGTVFVDPNGVRRRKP